MTKPKQWSRVKGKMPKRLTHVDDRAFRQLDAPLGEAADDPDVSSELGEITIGDLVDVDLGHEAFSGCRVVALVDDVLDELGIDADPDAPELAGPGALVEIPGGGELVVSIEQIVPGSKAKHYFGRDSVIEEANGDRNSPAERHNRREAGKIFALHAKLFAALERAAEIASQLNAVPDVNRYYSQHGGEIVEDVQESLRAVWEELTKGDAEQTELTWASGSHALP